MDLLTRQFIGSPTTEPTGQSTSGLAKEGHPNARLSKNMFDASGDIVLPGESGIHLESRLWLKLLLDIIDELAILHLPEPLMFLLAPSTSGGLETCLCFNDTLRKYSKVFKIEQTRRLSALILGREQWRRRIRMGSG